MQVKESNEVVLILDNPYAGVGLQAEIWNGEVAVITVEVDIHKGSGLPAKWSSIAIPGKLGALKVLSAFCQEMIEEIEKRLAVAQPVGQDEEESE